MGFKLQDEHISLAGDSSHELRVWITAQKTGVEASLCDNLCVAVPTAIAVQQNDRYLWLAEVLGHRILGEAWVWSLGTGDYKLKMISCKNLISTQHPAPKYRIVHDYSKL